MENLDRRMVLAGLGLVGAAAAASAASAGTLNPPAGPVAPTGKSTDEIEPRVAVESLAGDAASVFLISQPGSYYLLGNVNGVAGKAAIAIAADNVTLDLGGFALIGVAGATRGIEIRSSQIVVRNGSIRGFDAGILGLSQVNGVRIEGISVAGGGGIRMGAALQVRVHGCELFTISGSGIELSLSSATLVEDCVVSGCQGTGPLEGILAAVVIGCTVETITSSAQARGIIAQTANDCFVDTVNGGTASIGIQGAAASNCRIRIVGSGTGGAGVTGLDVDAALNCSVTVVGSATSTTPPIGISAVTAQGCQVSTVGNIAALVGATGITVTGAVSNCSVASVSGGGTTAITGISGDVVAACSVTSISGASSAATSGISGGALARDCSVTTITNTGAGSAIGLNRPSVNAGSIENCVFRSCGDVAVSVSARQRIVGCNISLTTTGILATSARNVIDGNTVDSCTTGISVTSGVNTAHALVVRNQVRNCTTDFQLDPPCQSGPVVSAVGVIASTNPWANFTD